MSILTRPYTKHARELVVSLITSGKTIKEVVAMTGVSDPTIRLWVSKAGRQHVPQPATTQVQQPAQELMPLLLENQKLHQSILELEKKSLEEAAHYLLVENDKLRTRVSHFEYHAAQRAKKAPEVRAH